MSLTSKVQNIHRCSWKCVLECQYLFLLFHKCSKLSKRLLLIINIAPRSLQSRTKDILRPKWQKLWKYPFVIYFNAGSGAVIDYKELVLTHSWSDIIGRLETVSTRGGGGGGWQSFLNLIERCKLQLCRSVKHQLELTWQNIDTQLGYDGWHGLGLCFLKCVMCTLI